MILKISKKEKASPAQGIALDKWQQQALDLMENTKSNILLTGRAGTGKSEVLKRFRDRNAKNIVVLAYTGVAALNIKGQTIHSFFGFNISVTPATVPTKKEQGIYKKLDAIVIDEISMVRADLMDCIDIFLRKNGLNTLLPFGGIQMIFIGDLFQLPPIIRPEERKLFEGSPYTGPYFFNSKIFTEGVGMDKIELKEMHRQNPEKQKSFIELLNAIREGVQTDEHIVRINQRHDQAFDEDKKRSAVHLVTTNDMAKNFNERKLDQLKKGEVVFKADVEGEWGKNDFPTDQPLRLKVGCQIMMLNNDSERRWVNGDIGKVLKIDEEKDVIEVQIVGSDRPKDYVRRYKWSRGKYSYNETKKEIEYKEDEATFSQYPMKLAWAFTIHKAQGKTFDEVVIDFGNGTWAHGQAYVALSRGRTLEKTTLRRPVKSRDIIVDKRIIDFMKNINSEPGLD